jgi:hypothetical protein
MHAVYRMFDAERHLLYVGRTGNAGQRFGDHSMKRWFPLVKTIELEWCATRAEAVLAERRAIRSEHPRYNIAETPRALTPAARRDIQLRVRYPAGTPAPTPAPLPGSARERPRPARAASGSNLEAVSIPDAARATLMTLLSREEGITTRKAAPLLEVSVWTARIWLERLRSEGVAQVYGLGRAAHWHVPEMEDGDRS